MRWPQKFGPFRWLSGKAIIAPFWARVDEDLAFKNGNSKVYYQAYEQSSQGHPQKEMIPTEFGIYINVMSSICE